MLLKRRGASVEITPLTLAGNHRFSSLISVSRHKIRYFLGRAGPVFNSNAHKNGHRHDERRQKTLPRNGCSLAISRAESTRLFMAFCESGRCLLIESQHFAITAQHRSLYYLHYTCRSLYW